VTGCSLLTTWWTKPKRYLGKDKQQEKQLDNSVLKMGPPPNPTLALDT
jgi:hypothetical protein